MVAELFNYPIDAIHFGLRIASCDCNTTISVSRVGHIIAAVERKLRIGTQFLIQLAKHYLYRPT